MKHIKHSSLNKFRHTNNYQDLEVFTRNRNAFKNKCKIKKNQYLAETEIG